MLIPAYIIDQLNKREQQNSVVQPLPLQIEDTFSESPVDVTPTEDPAEIRGTVELDFSLKFQSSD